MTKRKSGETIDVILLGLVPKIVDIHPETVQDARKYWKYAQAQANEFLGELPAEYTAGLTKKTLRKEKSAVYICEKSPLDLVLGFKPEFKAYGSSSGKNKHTLNIILCPLYDLLFKPVPTEAASLVIQKALQHFFVYQQDMDAGTLKVAGFKAGKRVLEDLPLLERYLSKGTIVDARTDCGDVGQARYRI